MAERNERNMLLKQKTTEMSNALVDTLINYNEVSVASRHSLLLLTKW